MFERFTDGGRRVVILAQEETRALGHGHIGGEHFLLGMLRQTNGLAAQALAAVGVTHDDIRARVVTMLGTSKTPPGGHIPFTPEAKQTLERSLRESVQLGHDYIGPEHVLLGLLRLEDATAATLLTSAGVDLNALREELLRLMKATTPAESGDTGYGPPPLAGQPRDPEAFAAILATLVRRHQPPATWAEVLEALRRQLERASDEPHDDRSA
jgi:ATP-dependent Clp protease ATP-binding subunit ClpC